MGTDHPDLIPTLRAAAMVQRKVGDYARVIGYLEEVLRIQVYMLKSMDYYYLFSY